MKISAVLPLKMTGRHYVDNVGRCDILFSSLRAFTSPNTFDKFLIVVPHDEVQEAKRYSEAWSDFPVEILDESVYFGVFKDFSARHQIRPWHRQQIIKLYTSELIDTEYFLVLDPDIFATRAFDVDTLLPAGRALTYCQSRKKDPSFWSASAELLRLDPHLERDGLWVTPAILSRTLCRSLHSRLSEIHGKEWMRVLLSHYMVNWTEYTLYWLNAEDQGLLDKFHLRAAPGETQLHTDESIWYAGKNGENLKKWDAGRHFAPEDKGIFAVIQSNTGLDIPSIVKKLEPYMTINVQPYTRHSNLWLKTAEFYSAVARRGLGLLRQVTR